ncbi:MAG: hypothetical protein M3067_03770 [Chloroflexota bacterium]|nr:hypothetical protein [Chloroflexota bacterium]
MTERRERDSTVVVTDRGGSGMGVVVGVVLIVLLLVVVWYLTLGPGAGKSSNPGGVNNPVPSIKVPAAS